MNSVKVSNMVLDWIKTLSIIPSMELIDEYIDKICYHYTLPYWVEPNAKGRVRAKLAYVDRIEAFILNNPNDELALEDLALEWAKPIEEGKYESIP